MRTALENKYTVKYSTTESTVKHICKQVSDNYVMHNYKQNYSVLSYLFTYPATALVQIVNYYTIVSNL